MAERKFTDLELERLLSDDLPAARTREIEESPADRVRLDELRAEHAAFLAQIDVAAEVRAIDRRAAQLAPEPPQKRLAAWWRWAMTGGALAAAAATVFLVVRRRGVEPDGEDDDLRTKGSGITFVIHAQSRELATGDAIAPGEKIRFEVGAPRRGYVAVFGVAAAGETTVYYPYGATAPAAYDPGVTRLLPGAIQLDAAPGAERFYAVYAEAPFAIDAVVPAVRQAHLPAGVSSAEVVLEKLVK